MYHDKSCYRDKVNRAAGQRTGVMVFADATYILYLDMKLSPYLPGFSHLDTSDWTINYTSVYRDLVKNHATATQTATNQTAGPLAIIRLIQDIRLPALQVIKCIMTRNFFNIFQFVPRHAIGAFENSSWETNPATWTNFVASLISLPTHLKKIGLAPSSFI